MSKLLKDRLETLGCFSSRFLRPLNIGERRRLDHAMFQLLLEACIYIAPESLLPCFADSKDRRKLATQGSIQGTLIGIQ